MHAIDQRMHGHGAPDQGAHASAGFYPHCHCLDAPINCAGLSSDQTAAPKSLPRRANHASSPPSLITDVRPSAAPHPNVQAVHGARSNRGEAGQHGPARPAHGAAARDPGDAPLVHVNQRGARRSRSSRSWGSWGSGRRPSPQDTEPVQGALLPGLLLRRRRPRRRWGRAYGGRRECAPGGHGGRRRGRHQVANQGTHTYPVHVDGTDAQRVWGSFAAPFQ